MWASVPSQNYGQYRFASQDAMGATCLPCALAAGEDTDEIPMEKPPVWWQHPEYVLIGSVAVLALALGSIWLLTRNE